MQKMTNLHLSMYNLRDTEVGATEEAEIQGKIRVGDESAGGEVEVRGEAALQVSRR